MLILLFAFFVNRAAASDAQDLTRALQQQHFKCENSHCRGKISSYSLPVHIFIPAQLQRRKPVLLSYHLHGWWQDRSTTPFEGVDGDFLKFARDSQSNVIVIVPESYGRNDTYASDLNNPQQMILFFQNIEGILNRSGLVLNQATPRTLSGHSGAYMQMGKMGEWAKTGEVPQLRSLRGFALFDSAYGYRDGLTDVMEAMCLHRSPVYFLAFNPADGQTQKRDTNARIQQEIKGEFSCNQRVFYYPNSKATHGAFPRLYMAAFLREAAR